MFVLIFQKMTSSVGVTFDSLYEELSRQLRLTGNIKNISEEFSKLKNDFSRATFTLNLQQVNDIIKCHGTGGTKSNVDALKFKDLGNKQFQKGHYDEAIKLYTKSIAYAPVENEATTLAVSYANRSAALFHKGLHEVALLDIERAIGNNYPMEMCYKLYERKGKCSQLLGDKRIAADCFTKALSYLPSSNLSQKKIDTLQKDIKSHLEECVKDSLNTDLGNMNISENLNKNASSALDNLEFPEQAHEVFSSLSDACDVAYTVEQGRFITAKRDIKPGEIVLIEQPFASVVLLEHSLTHCHYCFKKTIAPIPSLQSCFAVFCKESCRESATSFHMYEWSYLEAIAKSGVGKFAYLAQRTVTKCGPEFLVKFKKELDDGFQQEELKQLQGCGRNGKYEGDEFNAIYNLVTHAADRSVQDLFRRSVMAVFLLKFIESGSFFDNLHAEVDEKDFRNFVAGLILSHLQAFPCNAHEISELEIKKGDIAASLPLEIGAGIYSTLSLFNHSCDPVANRNFYGDTCVVRTIKPVKKGEEISDNYGAVYAVHSWEERRAKLEPQYYFKCACQACMENWPLYPEINNQIRVWKCSYCTAPLRVTNSDTTLVYCTVCKTEQNIAGKAKALENSLKNYELAFANLLEGDIEKALPIFLLHLQILDKLLCLPWRDFNNCQEAIKQCFSIMGNHVEI